MHIFMRLETYLLSVTNIGKWQHTDTPNKVDTKGMNTRNETTHCSLQNLLQSTLIGY